MSLTEHCCGSVARHTAVKHLPSEGRNNTNVVMQLLGNTGLSVGGLSHITLSVCNGKRKDE